jgi:hypothetical protein
MSDNKARLRWTTFDESNVSNYIIERSTDGRQFKPVATVNAQGGSQQQQYSQDDAAIPGRGKIFYRLQIVQKDGTVSFSSIIMLNGSKLFTALQLQPNPANTHLQLSYQASTDGLAEIRLIDALGRTAHRQQEKVYRGNNAMLVNDIQHLPAGTYVVELRQGGESAKARVVVAH